MTLRTLRCSFCHRRDSQVAKLVAGPVRMLGGRVYICDRCAAQTIQIMESHSDDRPRGERQSLFRRTSIASVGCAARMRPARGNVGRRRNCGTSLLRRRGRASAGRRADRVGRWDTPLSAHRRRWPWAIRSLRVAPRRTRHAVDLLLPSAASPGNVLGPAPVSLSPAFAGELSIAHQPDDRAQIVIVKLAGLLPNICDDVRHHVVEQLVLAARGMKDCHFQMLTDGLQVGDKRPCTVLRWSFSETQLLPQVTRPKFS